MLFVLLGVQAILNAQLMYCVNETSTLENRDIL